jgi:hypothetical protein
LIYGREVSECRLTKEKFEISRAKKDGNGREKKDGEAEGE